MNRVRPFRHVATGLVAIAMLHAVADAAQACEHDGRGHVATATSTDAHAGHHGSAPQDRDVSCDDTLRCCVATATGTLAEVATVEINDRPIAHIAEHVAAEPRSLILPPDPPPPRD